MAAITYQRLYRSDGGEYTGLGSSGRIYETYTAPGMEFHEAVSNLASQTIDGQDLYFGAQHKTLGTILKGNFLVDGYQPVSRIGSGTDLGWEIRVSYSPSGWFRAQEPVDRNASDFATYELSGAVKTVKTPVFHSVEGVVPAVEGTGIPAVTVYAWEREDIDVLVHHAVVKISIVLPNIGTTQISEIFSQQNKIHDAFGGQANSWLFMQPNVRRTAKNKYQVTYTWKGDPGSPQPAQPPDTDTDLVVRPPARGPHEEYRVVWDSSQQAISPNHPKGRPKIVTHQPYQIDSTGYFLLPGNPVGQV